MDELLKKLLEAEVLSPETKKELETAFADTIKNAVDAAKKDAEAQVRAELTEQWVKERDTLIDAVDAKVTEYLGSEITELKEDIERFRDLEAEKAEELVEAKAEMGKQLQSDLTELVEKLDAFLEIRLAAEMDELKDDIEQVKKLEFGRKIFEAVTEEYRKNFVNKDETAKELTQVRESLAVVTSKLEQETKAREKIERKVKLDEVLSPLSGRQRDIMETILQNVATEDLQDGYKTFIGRVLKESTEATSEKEKEKVLAEGATKDAGKTAPAAVTEVAVVTGDVVQEAADKDNTEEKPRLSREEKAKLQRLAGIK